MWKNHQLILNRRPNVDKLLRYDFVKINDNYCYSEEICDGMFLFNMTINNNEETIIEIIDMTTNEEYDLAYVENSVGAFVKNVRNQCDKIILDIVNKCYEYNYFKSDYTQRVIKYVEDIYGTKAEYLWEKFSRNAIFRVDSNNKWYAVLLIVDKRKIGLDEDGEVEIINLKETPENVKSLVDGKKYFFGFHMNKKHWYTICLDGSVPYDKIIKHIGVSYNLVRKN